MKTIAGVTIHGLTSWPANTDLSPIVDIYRDGSNFKGVEESDSLESPLPASVTAGAGLISSITATPFTIPAKYFGAHFSNYTDPLPITCGTIRALDCGVSWHNIETSAGVHPSAAVEKLQAIIALAISGSRDLIYTVPFTPAWASSNPTSAGDGNGTGTAWCPASWTTLTDHVNYILGIMDAAGKTDCVIEGWNEPNTPDVYKDSIGNLVTHQQTIWDAVQAYNAAHSTTFQVMCPSYTDGGGVSGATQSLDNFLAQGGGAYCDIIGYHIYTGGSPCGLIIDLSIVDRVKTVMAARSVSGKELWISEAGNSRVSELVSTNYIKRIFLYCAAKGVKRLCWYSYDHPGVPDMRLSNAVWAWEQAVSLLSGKTVSWVNLLPGGKLAASIAGTAQII